jgi:Uma2 family endonuclease
MTTDEYFHTQETMLPQELVWGMVRSAAAPAPGHQRWVARLLIALTDHVERHRCGQVWPSPIDAIFDPERHLVVQPDLIVVSNDRDPRDSASAIHGDLHQSATRRLVRVPRQEIGDLQGKIARCVGLFSPFF